jgi:ubiquinone/menaquinone biosynthesis C-methylase UbiE
MKRLASCRGVAACALVCLQFAAVAAQQKHVPAEAKRLIELLELGPGKAVADVGAGSGEMTFELARQLGDKARVYSTDINPKTVRELKDGAVAAGLKNIVVLGGAFEQTNLPDGCCDALILRHVYHHFANPPAMNASILKALKPGGFYAVMDFAPDEPSTTVVPPARRGSGDTHGVLADTVAAELKAAGFEIVRVLPEWPGGLFMVLARRPS